MAFANIAIGITLCQVGAGLLVTGFGPGAQAFKLRLLVVLQQLGEVLEIVSGWRQDARLAVKTWRYSGS